MHKLFLGLLLVTAVPAQDPDGKASPASKNTGVPLASSGPATVTNTNMTLVRHWHRASGVRYNDIWGWTSPDGREFAFVGETRGIWFVETTDPSNIRQIGWWSAPNSTWRDFKNLGHYVYSVSEHHRGIRVFDMSNPDAPVDLGYVEQAAIANTHNISTDNETGHLYLSGTNQGLMVYDASQNPTAPTLVGTWYPGSTYTHDCCIVRGRAYLSNGRSYTARIMDVSNPSNLVEIGRCNTPGGYDHNVWVTEDDQLLCVTDEIARGSTSPHMTVWDISDPRSPTQVGNYDLNTIVHNVFILGRTAYMSHYVDGVHIVDLADPTQPSMIAEYDTSTVSGGYAGCWGIYPFADHGLVYASDMENGLYVFQVECGHLNRYGAGTVGTGGQVPQVRLEGATPRVNAANLRLEVDNLEPNARFALFLSAGQASNTVLGVELHVDLANGFVSVPRTADANGHASVPLRIPNNQNLGNQRLYMQIVAIDNAAATGISASRGMWMGICQ